MTEISKCEMRARIEAQRFVNKARAGKTSYTVMAIEYFELLWYLRYWYGFQPMIFDRLPGRLQEAIEIEWNEMNKE